MPSDKAKEKKEQRKALRAAGLPPGVKLPPGVTPEQFQRAMAQRQAQMQAQQQAHARQQAMRQQQLAAQKKAQEEAAARGENEEDSEDQQVQTQQQPVRRQRPPPPPWFKGDDRHLSITLYPIYINKAKTVAGGRRVPTEIAIPRPHIQEMFVVLQHAGYKVIMVHKMHPRDTFKGDVCNVGRLHILFKNEDGTPVKPDIAKNKNELLRYICSKIPKLKSRAQHTNQPNVEELEQPTQQQSVNTTNTSQQNNNNNAQQQSTPNKKKPKRTKRGKR